MTDRTRRVMGVALGALLLRLFLLLLRGDYIVFDEGYYLLLARSLRAGHGFSLNGLPHVALSPLQPVLVAALSLTGIPDLWASRLLAAICGAALVVPVASLAGRWFGDRGAVLAAACVALAPPLLSFLPFFPGEGWNLYFGSEPLFLLLATSAVAVAARALDGGRAWQWFAAGALADLSYCTRLEGAVLGTALGIVLLVALVRARDARGWLKLAAYTAGIVVAVPYLLYLHHALGRWAFSGRVQAVASGPAPAPVPARPGAPVPEGAGAVEQFVWGGDTGALWRTLYALDGSGTQLSSQYWGVPRKPVVPVAPAAAAASVPPPPPASRPSFAGMFVRAFLVVMPRLLFLFALGGLAAAWLSSTRPDLWWLLPMVVTAIVPALAAYAEPRALLMLVPAACALAGGGLAWGLDAAERDGKRGARWVVAALLAILVVPVALDAARSWKQDTDLQRVASARRVVGEFLGTHLPPGSRLVSWHPAIAIWAKRDWRVLPYARFADIVRYADAQDARTLVFSRFDPSPIPAPPRAFMALLLDSAPGVTSDSIHLEPVDETPQLFVGRLVTRP